MDELVTVIDGEQYAPATHTRLTDTFALSEWARKTGIKRIVRELAYA